MESENISVAGEDDQSSVERENRSVAGEDDQSLVERENNYWRR